MPSPHPNQLRILEFDFDQHSAEDQRRLCLEVPCTVDLSHCNVIVWFEGQVRQKLKKSEKWRIYEDPQRTTAYLQRRGSFLFEKYLSPLVDHLRTYNRRLLSYIVWNRFRRRHIQLVAGEERQQLRERETEDELSINTIFDTSSLLNRSRSLSQESSMSILTPASFQFNYDLDQIITSTQRSEAENS